MIKDAKVRRSIAVESHLLFFSVYFAHYIEYGFADCHREMFALTEDATISTLVVTAAREIGKSTILNTSLAAWSILGRERKKFLVILGQTQVKARQHFLNFKKELEENELLKKDLGPFKEESGEWGSALVLPYYNARIAFASTEQSIRGMRHKQYRPDLIIADDLEDNDSVKTLDRRNKTYDWLTKDVIPAGSRNTRLIVIGTLLHEDSLMVRLKKEIQNGKRNGVYREYPLVCEEGEILWPSKFPDEASIEQERLRVGDEKAWFQEYLLRIISDADRVIHPEWIHYYETLPKRTKENRYRYTRIGIDLAISQKERSDCTAMVAASVFGYGKNMRAYILPNPINERLDFPSALERAKLLSSSFGEDGKKAKIFVENNQYQEAFPQMLREMRYPAEGVRSFGDKRTRLTIINPAVKCGQVLFPKNGAEVLIQQLIGFGVEAHDDLADAFSLIIGEIVKDNPARSPSETLAAMSEQYKDTRLEDSLLHKRF